MAKKRKKAMPVEEPTSQEQSAVEEIAQPTHPCAECPYSAHGFVCWSDESHCLRTEMMKINEVKKDESGTVQ